MFFSGESHLFRSRCASLLYHKKVLEAQKIVVAKRSFFFTNLQKLNLTKEIMMELSDKDLIERCLAGKADCFRHLVLRYERPLFAYLMRRLKDRQLATDAAQESLIRAYLGLSNLQKPEAFHSWLIGIGARVALEFYRAHKRQLGISGEIEEISDEKAQKFEEYQLDEMIAELPEKQRQMILLRYYESYSCLQIAEALNVPVGTVTKTISRAYDSLRQKLQTEGFVFLEAQS